jgi:hypothetical protein
MAIRTWMYRTEYHGRCILVIASPQHGNETTANSRITETEKFRY